MTALNEELRLTVYSPGVESLGGAVDFQRRENILSGASSLGGGRAKPLEARTETMRSKIRLVDDGSITGEMYNSDGEPIILGRLVEVEVRWDGGTWERVAAGRVVGVNQTEVVREYELQIADEGQLLREQSAFASDLSAPFGGGADTAAVLPRGLIDPWRDFDGGRTVRYKVDALEGSSNEAVKIVIGGELDNDTGGSIRKGPAALTDELQDLILDDVREDASAFSKQPALEDGRGDFRTLRFHDVGTDSDQEVFAVGDLTGSFDSDGEYRKPMQNPLILWVYWPGHTLSVGDEGDFYLYMPNHEPTEALPKHFGGESGVRQWQHLKDGLDATGVRYDTSAVDALVGQGELIWPRVTEDLTMMEHLRRTVLWPNGYMLAPNESGELTPVRITIPRSDEVPDVSTLPTLDKSTVSGPDYPTWSHTREDQVTVLKFKSHSMQGPISTVYRGPPTKGDTSQISRRTSGSADGLRESVFEIEKTHETDTFGRHEMEIHLSGMKDRATFQRIASHLAQMIFDRWGSGTIISELGALKTHDGVGVGEFVIIDLADFPNGAIQDRGGQRLVQVIERVKDLRPGVTLRVLDAGPNSQPLSAPSVSTSQNTNRPESVIDVTVSGLDADAEHYVLQYNKSTTDPADSDDGWTRVGSFPVSNTTPRINGLGAGTEYWVRARSTATDRLASDWSTHSSTTTAGFGSVTSISFSNITGSEALASWTLPNDEQPVQLTLTNTTQSQEEYSQRLDPGTSEKYLTGLSSGDSYELAVAMVDEEGNAGPTSTATFTAGSTNDTLPAPDFIGIQYGRAEHRGERSASAQTGMVVWTVPADPAVPLVFQRAPDDGSDNPDTGNITEFLPQAGTRQFIDTSVSPGDGPYWYRTLHRQQGYDDSSPSEWARAVPVALPGVIGPPPGVPLVDIDVLVRDDGQVDIYLDGEPRVRAFRYDACTSDAAGCSGFGDIDPTGGTLVETDSEGNSLVTNIDSLPKGQTVYVEVAAYSDADGENTPVTRRSSSTSRAGIQTTPAVEPSAQLREGTRSTGDIDYDLKVTSGSDVSNPDLRYRYKVDQVGSTGDYGSWTSIADANDGSWIVDAITNVQRAGKHPRMVVVQVQDEAPSSNPTALAAYPVAPQNDALDDSDGGKLDPGQPPGGGYSPPDGGTAPDVRVYFDHSHEGPQNLLGTDAGPEHSGTVFNYKVYGTYTLDELGLETGDVVSASADLKSDTGADRVRVDIVTFDSSSNPTTVVQGGFVTSSTYQRGQAENGTIPNDAVEIDVRARNADTTETAYARRAMLAKGPIAPSFVEPPHRKWRETAEDILRAADSSSIESVTQLLNGGGSAQKELTIGDFYTARHVEKGTGQDGDTVTFGEAYDTAPKVMFVPQVGRAYIDGLSSDQKLDMRAGSLSTSGFTIIARIVTAESTTAIDDGFGEALDGSGGGGETISSVGATSISSLEDEDGDTTTTTYVVAYNVDGPNGQNQNLSSLTVHVEVSADGGVNWTEVSSKSYHSSVDQQNNETQSFDANLQGGDDIRIRLSGTNLSGNFSVYCHAEGDTLPGVEYDRVDSSSEQEMTPNAGDKVMWIAMESSA